MPPLDKQSSRSDPAACRFLAGGAAAAWWLWGQQHRGVTAGAGSHTVQLSSILALPRARDGPAQRRRNPTAPYASPTTLLLRAAPAHPIHHPHSGQRHQQNTLFPRVLQVNKPSVPELPIATGTSMCVPITSQG